MAKHMEWWDILSHGSYFDQAKLQLSGFASTQIKARKGKQQGREDKQPSGGQTSGEIGRFFTRFSFSSRAQQCAKMVTDHLPLAQHKLHASPWWAHIITSYHHRAQVECPSAPEALPKAPNAPGKARI